MGGAQLRQGVDDLLRLLGVLDVQRDVFGARAFHADTLVGDGLVDKGFGGGLFAAGFELVEPGLQRRQGFGLLAGAGLEALGSGDERLGCGIAFDAQGHGNGRQGGTQRLAVGLVGCELGFERRHDLLFGGVLRQAEHLGQFLEHGILVLPAERGEVPHGGIVGQRRAGDGGQLALGVGQDDGRDAPIGPIRQQLGAATCPVHAPPDAILALFHLDDVADGRSI